MKHGRLIPLLWISAALSLLLATAFIVQYLQIQQLLQTPSANTPPDQSYADLIDEQRTEIESLNQKISDLQTELAKTSDTKTTASRFEVFTLVDGTTHYGARVSELPFTMKNATGSILHICDHSYIVQRGQHSVCLTESVLLLSFENEYSLIDSLPYSDLGDEVALSSITFNQGIKSTATTTANDQAQLLVGTNPLSCLWVDGMCLSFGQLSYILDLSSGSLTKVTFESYMYYPSGLIWNQAGTKAVYMTPCPAGCPDELVYGINIANNSSQLLLTREDYGDLFFDSLEWINNDSFNVLNGSTTHLTIPF